MKIQRLSIENYGIHKKRTLSFPESGLTVLYGANEAGKSTLLQLLRDALFEFPNQTPYRIASGEMAVEVDAILLDQSRIHFRKRKGRKDAFKGEIIADSGNSRILTKELLDGYLGNISRPLYESIFGFSLLELSQGQESLKRASFEEAVLGTAIGGTQVLKSLQNRLRESTNELFLPQGSRTLNKLLAQLKVCEQEIDAAITKPAGYRTLAEREEQLEKDLANIQIRLDACTARHNTLARHSSAYSHIQRRKTILEQLNSKPVPETFNQVIVHHWQRLMAERDRLRNSTNSSRVELEKLRTVITTFSYNETLVRLHAAICSAAQTAINIAKTRTALTETNLKLAQLDAELSKTIASLPIPESIAREILDRSTASDLLRHCSIFTDYKNQQQQFSDLIQSLEQNRLELDRLKNDSARELPTVDLHRLSAIHERLLEAMPRWRSIRRSIEKQRDDALRLDTDLAKIALQAGIASESIFAVDLIPSSVLERWSQGWKDRVQAIADSKQKVDEHHSEVEEAETSLRTQTEESQVPDSAQITLIRERRDSILGTLTTILESTTEPIPLLWQQALVQSLRLRAELQRQDQFHDRLVTHAKAVADRDMKVHQLEAKRKKLANAIARHEKEQQKLIDFELKWKSEYPALGNILLPPQKRLDWQTEMQAIRDRYTARQTLVSDLKEAEQEVRGLLESLGPLSNSIAGLDWETAVGTLGGQLKEWLKSQGKQDQRSQQISALEEKLAKGENTKLQFSRQHDANQREFRAFLDRFGIASPLTTDQAIACFEELSVGATKRAEANAQMLRLEHLKSDVSSFEHAIAAIGHELPPDAQFSSLPSESRIAEWKKRADESTVNYQSRQTYLGEIASLERTFSRETEELNHVESELSRLMNTMGAKNQDEVELWTCLFSERQQLQQQLQTTEAQIDTYRGPETLEAFIDKVQLISEDERLREISNLGSQIAIEKDHQQTVVIELDRARQSLASLNQNVEIEKLQVTRMDLVTQIAECSERWAVLQIEQMLLAKAAEEYQRKHTPQTLLLANKFIQQMTQGRYIEISADEDADRTLVLKRSDGESLEPRQLSTGTREQLYLALRLAYVEQYCNEHEPLPLIMDDCLVNFDDERAEACLRAISEMSDRVQKIVLTCHQRTVQLLGKIAPETSVIPLRP